MRLLGAMLAEFFSAVNIISGNRRKKHESRLPAFSCLARQTFFWCKKSLTISKDVFRPLNAILEAPGLLPGLAPFHIKLK